MFEIDGHSGFQPRHLGDYAQFINDSSAIVVLNTGAWWAGVAKPGHMVCKKCNYTQHEDVKKVKRELRYAYETALNGVFEQIKDAQASVIYRSLAPAHTNCSQHRDAEIQAAWFWREFELRNRIVRRIVERTNEYRAATHQPAFVFMDVFAMSDRWTEHPGHRGVPADHTDCLHWCVLGADSIVSRWNDLLLMILQNTG